MMSKLESQGVISVSIGVRQNLSHFYYLNMKIVDLIPCSNWYTCGQSRLVAESGKCAKCV